MAEKYRSRNYDDSSKDFASRQILGIRFAGKFFRIRLVLAQNDRLKIERVGRNSAQVERSTT
jgi:hypothetical protein